MAGCSAGPPAAERPRGQGDQGDKLRLEVTAPPEVPHGVPVPISLRLLNPGTSAATVYLQGRPTAFDIIIETADGRPVWHRLGGQTITAILGVYTIEAGGALTFEDVWPQTDQAGVQVPPGRYSIQAELPTDADPYRSRAELTVRPPT